MITTISGINFNPKKVGITHQPYVNLPIAKKDSFAEQKFHLSFGSVIPKKEVFRLCKKIETEGKNISGLEETKHACRKFFAEWEAISEAEESSEKNKSKVFHQWRHELDNLFQNLAFNKCVRWERLDEPQIKLLNLELLLIKLETLQNLWIVLILK